MANDEEELQRLTSDDSDETPAYKPASRSPCIKHFGGGLMLLPLPHGSELRITVSASTPARRRKFITALVAALFCGLVWNYWKTWQPYHDPLDWSPDFSVKRIPSPPLRSNQRASFFTDSSPGLSCRGQMAWDPSRLSWYKAEFEQNTGALANGYPYPDEYAFSVTSPLNISQGATVLDVGCGSGYFVGLLWKHMDIRIAGIDPLPFFVQAAGNAFPDGSFCSASATNMSVVPDGFADVVIMNFPMNHLSDSDALLAVKEVWRVLKSGGAAFFGEQNRAAKGWQWGREPKWWLEVAVPALQINAKDLLFGESILHGDYWPRYHTYLRKGDRAWNIFDAV